MKKLIAEIVLFSMFFIVTPFAIQAQELKPAKVTVTIKSLKAKSSDACGEMDFFAKIYIGGGVKSFQVREGNNVTDLNWQYTSLTLADKITFSVEIWDDDDFACGGGDDRVNVDGTSNKITQTFSTLLRIDRDMITGGAPSGSNEVANIIYHITIEPAVASVPVTPPSPLKTMFLTKGIWKIVEIYRKIGSGWFPTFKLSNYVRDCQKDNYYKFNSDGTYQLNDGLTKCAPADPQIIETGTWSFLENETKLQLVKTGILLPDVFRIVISTTSLSLYRGNSRLACTH
jgi:hypothetical protein